MRILLWALALFISASAPIAGAERLWVIPGSSGADKIRWAIDVDSIRFESTKDDSDIFIHALVTNSSGDKMAFTTYAKACDEGGGRGAMRVIGNAGESTPFLWRKGGSAAYDHIVYHICDWVLVMTKEAKPGDLERRFLSPSAPKPTKPKVQA